MLGHLVYKQKVTLHLPRKDEAAAFQERVSKLLRNELNESLERILDEAFPPDKIIRIDSLQLDLGNISAQNFESEFKKQFVDVLTKSLASKRDSISDSGSTTGQETVLSKAQSLENALIFFLERGYLPWYSSVVNKTDWENEISAHLPESGKQHFMSWLRDNYAENPMILDRLISQFSDKFIGELCAAANTHFTDPWEAIYADYAFIIKSFDDNTSPPAGFTFSRPAIRAKIWQQAIPVLLTAKTSDPVFLILNALFAFLRITGKALYPEKENDIGEGLKTKTVSLAFYKLVAFLRQEDVKCNDMENSRSAGKQTGKNNTDEADTGDTSRPAKTRRENSRGDDTGSDNSEGPPAPNNGLDIPAASKSAANKPAVSIKKRNPANERDVVHVNNSGVVILHPFLKRYFESLELAADGKFINDEASARAVLLLNYLVTGEEEAAEFDLTLQKILCGHPLEDTLPASIKISDNERTESDNLLNSVISHWEPLKNTSIAGFRGTFLQRNGSLELKENGWLLTVEQKTVDILLGKLPWGFSTVRLPWMKHILSVDWY
jgi:hypothetical protein